MRNEARGIYSNQGYGEEEEEEEDLDNADQLSDNRYDDHDDEDLGDSGRRDYYSNTQSRQANRSQFMSRQSMPRRGREDEYEEEDDFVVSDNEELEVRPRDDFDEEEEEEEQLERLERALDSKRRGEGRRAMSDDESDQGDHDPNTKRRRLQVSDEEDD